jgi:hypothetical protein
LRPVDVDRCGNGHDEVAITEQRSIERSNEAASISSLIGPATGSRP